MRKVYLTLAAASFLLSACSNTAGGPGIDGIWQVSNITCNAQPAAAGLVPKYTSPNSITLTVSDTTGQASVTQATNAAGAICSITVPQGLNYTSANSLTLTPSGAVVCNPINCGPASVGCGQPTSLPATGYTYSVAGLVLTLTSTDGNDPLCASVSQTTPIIYTETKVR